MIDNNIIKSLGAGSGVDTNNLVKQLVAIERSAPQSRIDTKTALAETRISDFGLLSSALSTLKDAASALVKPEALFSKTASYTESDALVPLELGTDVQAGSYSFNVSQVAQAHTLAFSGFASADVEVGEGELSFSFGSWSRDSNGDIDGDFTQNTDKETFTVTIDANNNSLKGLRDAINNADMGVTASIIYDGSSYNLSIVSASGAENELEISVAEAGGSATNDDDSDLSRFGFDDAKKTFDASAFATVDAQGGQNAILSLNGITIERATNTIDDIVTGLKIDVLKSMASTEKVTITVSQDKNFAEQNVRDFVEAYNTFLEAVKPVFGQSDVENDEGKKETVTGSLANDSLAKSLLSQIRNVIASSIPGLSDSNFSSLTNIGIRTDLNGNLSINEKTFKDAFENRFEDVQKLLAPYKSTSDDNVYINSYNSKTKAGEYSVSVTQAPTRGYYEGAAFNGIAFPLTISDDSYSFAVNVNGKVSSTLTIPAASYNDEDELAVAIQSLINGDSNLSSSGYTVAVSYDSLAGGFDLVSNAYGASSIVSFTSASTNAADNLGLSVNSGTLGTKALGTINGVSAFGSANVLLPQLGEAGEGLGLIVAEGFTGDITVNFSRGFAGELESLIDSFLTRGGVIATRTENLADNIDSYEEEQTRLDRRIEAYEELMMNQFIVMERIIASLNSSGSFLDNLIDTLPFTSGRDR